MIRKHRSTWVIGLDFDGTVCKNEFPEIGEPVPHALDVLRELVTARHRIVLWTVRSGRPLDLAVDYLRTEGIEPWGINRNPTQPEFSDSPKAHCHVFIDDRNVCMPLKRDSHPDPWVDWLGVRHGLVDLGILVDIEHGTIPF